MIDVAIVKTQIVLYLFIYLFFNKKLSFSDGAKAKRVFLPSF